MKLIEEIEQELKDWDQWMLDHTIENGSNCNENCRIMSQVIDQYRLEMYNSTFKETHKKPIDKKTKIEVWKWQIHLHLHGSLIERLEQVLENEGNFLAYIY